MKPTAFTHDYGTHQKPWWGRNVGTFTFYSGGTVPQWDDSQYFPAGVCQRFFHTGNPVMQRDGYKWRNPSQYYRSIIEWKPGASGTYKKYSFDGYWTSVRSIEDNGWTYGTATAPYLSIWSATLDSGAYSIAETKCLSKLAEGKANLSEAIAQYKQAINMVADPLSRLYRILIAAKRGQWRTVYRWMGLPKAMWDTTGAAASTYLAWLYGWAPAMGDIHGAMEVLKGQDPSGLLIHARASHTINDSLGNVEGWTRQGNCKRTYRSNCSARISGELVHQLGQVGLANPYSLAWELTPWSFVVDWALPIGPLLEGLGALSGLEFVGGSGSHSFELEATITDYGPGGGWICDAPATATVRRFVNERWPIGTFPMPDQLAFKSPISTSHAVTAAALARQLLRL